MNRYAMCCCSALALLTSGAISANEEDVTPSQWLDRMALAVETLDYRGTLVQIRDGQMSTFEVIRRVDESGIKERVYALDGTAEETIRDGDRFRSTVQGRPSDWFQSTFQPRLMPHQPLDQLAELGLAYDLALGGQERVAGYQVQRIDIRPKDQYRYGQQLWLEQQTGMLLRSAIVAPNGEILGQQTFVHIDIGASISDRDLEPQTAEVFDAPRQPAWSDEDATKVEMTENEGLKSSGLLRPLWAPRKVPAHFRLINANHGRSDLDSAFDHLLFSDGLTSFSVYIDHAPHQPVPTQLDVVGTLHVLTGMMGQRQFTIMGQVPRQTVLFVGQQFLSANDAQEQ